MMARRGCMLLVVVLLGACQPQKAEVKPDSGHMIYIARCAVCHGENCQGLPRRYPPLVGSGWVNGPPARMAAIVLDGMQGPLGNYNAVMPGWRGVLRDAEISAVMTWLRHANGKAPVSPVEVAHVRVETEGRNTFWTANDLKNFRMR